MDIEKRIRNLENRIRELEETNFLYQSIFENLPYGIQIFDKEGFSFKLNEAQKKLLGMPNLDEGIGKFNVLNDPYAKSTGADKIYKKAFHGEKYQHQYEYDLGINDNKWKTRKDKRIFFETIIPVKNKLGEVIHVFAVLDDRTDITNAQRELLDANERFDMVMLATNDGIWDWNLLTDEIYFSPAWKKMLGYKDDELENKFSVWEELTAEEDVKRAWGELKKHISGEIDRFDVEFRMKHKNGNWVNIRSRANTYYDDNHKAYRVVGTHTDVTERNKIRKSLEDSEMRWKFAVEGNQDGLWDWNTITNEVYFSSQWKKMLGFSDNEISNKLEEWEKRVHPDDKKQVYADIEKHISGEAPVYINEHRVLCKDGSYKWILDRGKIISYTKDGKPERMIGTHTDISERKAIEAELQKNKILLTANEKLLQVGAWEYTIQTEEMYWSDGLYAIHEMDKSQELDHIAESIKCYQPEDREKITHEFNQCIQQGIAYDSEYPFTTYKGSKRWVRTKTNPVYQDGRIVKIIGSVADITNLKEKELQLKELNKTKDKLFSIIAHDLRSPFSSILGFSELALNSVKQGKYDNIEKHIGFIYKSAQQSFDLLNNLLQWSRIQTGKLQFKPTKLDIRDLIADLEHLLETGLEEKNLQLQIDTPDSLEVFADKLMLETIIRNLLSNAIKYSFENSTIELNAQKRANAIQISVKDYGTGINQNDINKILNPHEDFVQPGTNNEKGTGLGIMLCKEFVEKHNGKIRVESEEGKGAKFIIELPIH